MEFCVGMIVRAKAGRDKDGFFVITSIDNNFAYIADGKRRKIENPKKKKLIHLAATKNVAREFDTNRKVRKLLSEFQDN